MKGIALVSLVMVSLLCLISPLFSERLDPVTIKPITYKGMVFRVENRPNSMGIVYAYGEEDSKLIWKKKLYTVIYDRSLEGDVQAVYFTEMKIVKGKLVLKDELRRTYILNPKNGNAIKNKNQAK